jgi:hypothetical protein
MTSSDLLYLAFIGVVLLLDHFVLWPMFLRRSQSDPARARIWLWSTSAIMLWTMVLPGIVLWLIETRSWVIIPFLVGARSRA